ncbi:hypothetical protein BAG01nite_36960 [Brevibacillus agri]|uniref:Uncharacterized protein n=1 Tax=Brevibacillus agri TaxID=51101 RepID=A0ABQ0SUI5_9BACL|nr:hypothetical protein [Brevibacillus agri]GED27594.1 hypothetical protein BAG01nite_36960 [Brevibacillus agri]
MAAVPKLAVWLAAADWSVLAEFARLAEPLVPSLAVSLAQRLAASAALLRQALAQFPSCPARL